MDIFKLVGSVYVDTDDANKSLSKVGESAEKSSSKLGGVAATAGKVALGVGVAAAAVGTAMVKSAKETAANADEIDKASQRMKIGAESYQELAHATQLCGVDMSTMEQAAKKLEGTDMNLDDALAQIYELGTAEERSAKAAELFGEKVAYNMTPMLNASAEEMAAMKQEAHDLGAVMSEDSVKAGAEMNDTFTKLSEAFSGVANQIGATVMPIVSDLLNWVLEHMPQIQATVTEVVGFISEAIQAIYPIIEALSPLIEKVFQFIGRLWEGTLKPVLSAITKLLKGDFKGAFTDVFNGIKNLVSNVFNALISIVKNPLNKIIGYINTFIGGINKIKIPDWVPLVGGKGVNISYIPYLAKGGEITGEGSAIVGEAGAELVELPQGARVTPLNDNNNAFAEMTKKLDEMQSGLNALAIAIQNYNPQIVLSTGALVGELARPMDKALGNLTTKGMRGVIA